jgi:hypothetical protein
MSWTVPSRRSGVTASMRRGNIELSGLLDVVSRRLQERARHRTADVVHNNVEPPERIAGFGHQTRRLSEVGQIGHHDTGPAPSRLDRIGSRPELPGRVRGQNQVSAGLGQRERRRRTNAASRAGDDRDLAIDATTIEQDHLTNFTNVRRQCRLVTALGGGVARGGFSQVRRECGTAHRSGGALRRLRRC